MDENSCCNLINSDPESCSTKLCSSQPKTTTFAPSVGGPSIGVGFGQSSINDRPAVPPRNYQNVPSTLQSTMNPYNRYSFPSQRLPFNGGYSYGYGSSLPWSYNATPYGGYGMNGYNNFNSSNESRFIRAAEDSVRPTFQAIESLTRAINSVAFMMESTFGSLNMSFQAILSVIENFSHARTLLKQFVTSIITLRIFHKCFLVIINLLRKMNIVSETFAVRFTTLNSQLPVVGNTSSVGVSAWPILTFVGLVLGAPYFISRMLPSERVTEEKTEWNPETGNFVPLVGVHDFQAGNAQEVSFRRGQKLKMVPPEIMQPPSPYWVFVADENNQTGFVPRNHVAPA